MPARYPNPSPPFVQGFHLGDSAAEPQRKTWKTFFAEMDALKAMERPWTLTLRDPLANSFVSSVVEDPRRDPRMQARARHNRNGCQVPSAFTNPALHSAAGPPFSKVHFCLEKVCNAGQRALSPCKSCCAGKDARESPAECLVCAGLLSMHALHARGSWSARALTWTA